MLMRPAIKAKCFGCASFRIKHRPKYIFNLHRIFLYLAPEAHSVVHCSAINRCLNMAYK